MSNFDTSLLLCSSEWLERARVYTASKMNDLAHELRSIMAAQQMKSQLSDSNMVAVQEIQRSTDGQINDICVKVINATNAKSVLEADDSIEGQLNSIIQKKNIKSDGFDI